MTRLSSAALVFVFVLALAQAAHADDRNAARAANTSAMRHYKAGELSQAVSELRASIAADPSWPQSHYNLACVASLLRDLKTARAELEWLKGSPDPDAKKRLEKGIMDGDLDWVSLDDQARGSLGLGSWSELADHQRLIERDGQWSFQARGTAGACTRTMTFFFIDEPDLKLRYQEECPGRPAVDKTYGGTWRDVSGISVEVKEMPSWPPRATLKMIACPGSKIPSSCFTLESGKLTIGPFSRGPASAAPTATATATAPATKPAPLGDLLRRAGKDLPSFRAAMADVLTIRYTDPGTGKTTQSQKLTRTSVTDQVWDETIKSLFSDLLEGGGELACDERKLVCTVTSNSGAALTYQFKASPSGPHLLSISLPTGE